MKSILILFLCFASMAYAQNLSKLKVNDNLSLEFPADPSIESSEDYKTYMSQFEESSIFLMIASDTLGILDEDLLNAYYEGFENGILEEIQGKKVSGSYIEIDNYRSMKTVITTDLEHMKLWHIYGVRVGNQTYCLQFIYPEMDANTSLEEKIIKSIRITK